MKVRELLDMFDNWNENVCINDAHLNPLFKGKLTDEKVSVFLDYEVASFGYHDELCIRLEGKTETKALVYEGNKIPLKTLEEIIIETKWVHQKTNKKCTVIGTYKVGQRERDYTFRITGWNPLPCKEFKGTYYILADWLTENGWVREVSNHKYAPDTVRYIHR